MQGARTTAPPIRIGRREEDSGTAPPIRRRRIWDVTLPVVVLAQSAVAAVTCFAFLGRKGLWLDEAYSVTWAAKPWRALFEMMATQELNMAPYYVVLHAWVGLGSSEGFVRIPSAVFAVGTVPLITLLADRLLGRRAAVWAGFLFAVNTFVVAHAQEARSYSLVMLLVTASTLLFVRGLDRSSLRTWLVYGAVTGVAAYAHYFAALVVVAQFLAVTPRRRAMMPLRQMLVGVVTVGLLWVPLAVHLLAQRGGPALSWVREPGAIAPIRLLQAFAGSQHLLTLCGPLLVVALAATIAPVVQRRRDAAQWGRVLLWLWLVVPPLLGYLVSQVKPVWVPRYFIVSLPAFLLLVADGLAHVRNKALVAAAASAGLVLSVLSLGDYYQPRHKHGENWRQAADHVLAQATSGSAVWYVAGSTRIAAEYYLQRRQPNAPPQPDRPVDISIEPNPDPAKARPGNVPPAEVERRLGLYREVWTVARSRGPTAEQHAMLASHGYRRVGAQRRFGPDVWVALYRRG